MKIRKTPLFYISLIILIVGLPVGIYGLTLPGWDALLGVFALLQVVGSWVLFVLEQLLLRLLKPRANALLLADTGVLLATVAGIMLLMNC
ncbi:hypothetical protein [Cesiribacter sp. SM1]|uniref:hypothetical protein n=1 Tax=Cesiribacter sp. SM1 TaxID=2861196 RepID=UPI001CD580FB|nr:hypothetical protein [Cesiribacter sp. SM1]